MAFIVGPGIYYGSGVYYGASVYYGSGVYYGPRIWYAPYGTVEEGTLYFDSADACLRFGRCSALDVYRFQDRPNRLLRLAPLAPPDPWQASAARSGPLYPGEVTPEENIVPAYRDASQVRPEYQDVGK